MNEMDTFLEKHNLPQQIRNQKYRLSLFIHYLSRHCSVCKLEREKEKGREWEDPQDWIS